MKYLVLFLLTFSWNIGKGQSKSKIDSINTIDFSLLVSDLQKSKTIFKNNIQNAINLNYKSGEIKSKEKLAIILFYLKDTDKGLAYAYEATTYYENQKDWVNAANCYADIGYIFKDSDLDLALSYFRKALTIGSKEDLKEHQEKIYNNYGVLQFKKSPPNYDSAIYFHKKAYEIGLNLKLEYAIPYSLNNLVTVYSAKGDYNTAFKYLNLSDTYRNKNKQSLEWADNLAYRADIYYDIKNYDSANYFYKKALTLSQQNNFMNLTTFCLNRLTDVNENTNNTSKALYYLKALQKHKDSIVSVESNIAIAKLQDNYETLQKEKKILEQESSLANQKIKITLLILGLVTLLFLAYFISRKAKLKQQKLQHDIELEKQISQTKIEKEKLRISRDLHDNIGSQLTYVISSLDNLNYIKDNSKRQLKLQNLEQFTKNTLTELRETIWTIQTKEISLIELYSKITSYVNKLNTAILSMNLSTKSNKINTELKLEAEQAINIYRTIQEAINNAIKYSEAKNLIVNFNQLNIIISDDGVGFNKKTIVAGNGLKNMENRIIESGFTICINSEKNKGTTIKIKLKKTP